MNFITGKIDLTPEVEQEILNVLNDLTYLKELKELIKKRLVESGFEKSDNLVIQKSKRKRIKISKALQLTKDEFDKLFDVTGVKPRRGVTLDDGWYDVTESISLRRRK